MTSKYLSFEFLKMYNFLSLKMLILETREFYNKRNNRLFGEEHLKILSHYYIINHKFTPTKSKAYFNKFSFYFCCI